MVRINKKYLSKELQAKAWNLFLRDVKKSESGEMCIVNLKKFLTPSEIIMLEKRLSIRILTERGLSYADIGKTLDVSSTTINFVKHNLTKRPVIHKKCVAREESKRKIPYNPRFKGGARLF